MTEQYVDILDFQGYKISSTGEVWSDKSNKKLVQFNGLGYSIVHLRKNKKSFARRVHRLVAAAFLDNYDDGLIVNHIDGNRGNNHADNLACLTQRENALHSVWDLDNGHAARRKFRLTEDEKQQIVDTRESGATVDEILKTFNISGAKYRDIVKPEKRYTEWIAKPIPTQDGERIALVDGYDHYYVSNLGNVYSTKRGINLSQHKSAAGYMQIALYKHSEEKRYLVHRLVASVFCDNPNNYDFVDHINECKTDNRAINLRWVTRSENLRRGMKKTRSITNEQVKLVRHMHRVGVAGTRIADIVGIGKTSVYRIIHSQERYANENAAVESVPDVMPHKRDATPTTKAIDKQTADDIRERYSSEQITIGQLSKEYNVGRATIHRVIHRRGGYA